MATGDNEDIKARIATVLPPWFGTPGTPPPILSAVLAMPAAVGSWLYDMLAFVAQQTRISTATGGWLDLIAFDFFGRRVLRRTGQNDDSFRRRIKAEMFRPRNTRQAMIDVLTDLTGRAPRIFEPGRPADTGGIGLPSGLAIGVSGAVGSISAPGQVWIDVFRDPQAGIPYAAGIGTPAGGIGVPSRLVIADIGQISGALTDEDVYSAIEATRAAGITCWVALHD